jgi:hypothetical protein
MTYLSDQKMIKQHTPLIKVLNIGALEIENSTYLSAEMPVRIGVFHSVFARSATLRRVSADDFS